MKLKPLKWSINVQRNNFTKSTLNAALKIKISKKAEYYFFDRVIPNENVPAFLVFLTSLGTKVTRDAVLGYCDEIGALPVD